ncbi:MAG TPA: alpha/beta fold hydrolase [Planctomycetaceae bacterium]|nr:alpha/beta fold hydrolase [Planctomycetaceae bacterium]
MRRISAFLMILFVHVATGTSTEPAQLPDTTPWNVEQLNKEPKYQWITQQGNVHSLSFAGEPYKGMPTRVFAYYASPATLGKQTVRGKTPGIVLVHGGGGAAFSEWAKLWAGRGYAAIAMDLAGRGAGRMPLKDGGPDQTDRDKFAAIDGPIKDQWSYHAVANVVIAHSLLLSLEEVDAERTALTGISWGGYLTCIVAGIDQRFKVAMPVYGCGFLCENSAWVPSQFERMKWEQVEKWNMLWDPSQYIGSATMPIMFLNGTNDFAYPMDSYAKTAALVRSEKNFSIQLQMRHGHIFDFPEFFLFIDQYIKGATPMPVVATPEVADGQLSARVKTATKLVSARLHYTTGPHRENKSRKWISMPLAVDGNKIQGKAAPAEATVWYVDVTDERDALVSSQVMIAAP